MSLNNEPCTIMSTVIDLNPIGLNYYPFMISLDKNMCSDQKERPKCKSIYYDKKNIWS